MHSLVMAENILQAALAEAEKYNGKRIEAICIRLDERDFVQAESLQFCLEAMAKGTTAEDAQIEIELGGAKELPQVTLKLD